MGMQIYVIMEDDSGYKSELLTIHEPDEAGDEAELDGPGFQVGP